LVASATGLRTRRRPRLASRGNLSPGETPSSCASGSDLFRVTAQTTRTKASIRSRPARYPELRVRSSRSMSDGLLSRAALVLVRSDGRAARLQPIAFVGLCPRGRPTGPFVNSLTINARYSQNGRPRFHFSKRCKDLMESTIARLSERLGGARLSPRAGRPAAKRGFNLDGQG
jgi:hypothetical protein